MDELGEFSVNFYWDKGAHTLNVEVSMESDDLPDYFVTIHDFDEGDLGLQFFETEARQDLTFAGEQSEQIIRDSYDSYNSVARSVIQETELIQIASPVAAELRL